MVIEYNDRRIVSYLAKYLHNSKSSDKCKVDFRFLKRLENVIVILIFVGCFCGVSSSTQSISFSFSIPYTVLLFDIVGISQGYITRTIRSAYPQPSDLPNLDIAGLTNSAASSSPTNPPTTNNVLKEQIVQYQEPCYPYPAPPCRRVEDQRTCTSENEVCLHSNYSKFQLPNKGAQTVVSIGEIAFIVDC